MSREGFVIIQPRAGVSAYEIREFLQDRFQQPGMVDDWRDPNPLVNADISCTPAEATP